MSEAASSLKEFKRRVMWRKRLLALQDRVALAVLASSVIAAAFVLMARLKEGGRIPWAILTGIFAIEAGAFLFNWVRTRANEREAAFAIDDTLELEDRVITAHEIIEQGGPKRVVETALIDDAATRVAGTRVSSIVPYRLKQWHALTLAGVVALVVTIMIPQKALPGGEAIAEARADIQAAGEELEQAATEAEQIAPAGSETAKLASEQAELGRSFRRSNESRAEALKKLSSLEGRIRDRHDVLASTRAEEIVNIAEKRLRAAISARPKQRSQADTRDNGEPRDQAAQPSDTEANDKGASAGRKASDQKNRPESDSRSIAPSGEPARARVNSNSASASNSNRSDVSAAQTATPSAERQRSNANTQAADRPALATSTPPGAQPQTGQSNPQNRPQKPVPSPNEQASSGNKNSSADKERGQNSSEAKGAGEDAGGPKEGDQKGENKDEQKPDGGLPASNPLGGMVAEQAAKALPQMSQELLKKAAQLRAGELTPEDIKRLAQAAEFLARDLDRIAQSKELQQALEQMARQINPEQLEQVARQLMNQEQLKRELEAAARLMMQNQQAKEMVAGIKQKVDDIAKQFRGRDGGEREKGPRGPGGDPARNGKGNAGGDSRLQLGRPSDGQKLKGQGKESNVGGNLQRGAGGEYLYLQTRAGAGAARAPYSSAYPQYRREAERSVQRSQVPPRMRSVVRSYFDAINPDASKKP
jgi:hypothetical protein